MTLKTYAAIVTGALGMVLTAMLLWAGTQLPIQDVVAASVAAYYAGLVGTFAVADRLRGKRRRDLADTIVTLVKEEQANRKEKAS